jgi:hypothetical protein
MPRAAVNASNGKRVHYRYSRCRDHSFFAKLKPSQIEQMEPKTGHQSEYEIYASDFKKIVSETQTRIAHEHAQISKQITGQVMRLKVACVWTADDPVVQSAGLAELSYLDLTPYITFHPQYSGLNRILQEFPLALAKFMIRAYGDDSCGSQIIDHCFWVFNYAACILEQERVTVGDPAAYVILYTIMLHEVMNPRYAECIKITTSELSQFLGDHVGNDNVAQILRAQANCSWSKRTSLSPDKNEFLVCLLRDANWLDSLGYRGIERVKLNIPADTHIGQRFRIITEFARDKIENVRDAFAFPASRQIADDRYLLVQLYEVVK